MALDDTLRDLALQDLRYNCYVDELHVLGGVTSNTIMRGYY